MCPTLILNIEDYKNGQEHDHPGAWSLYVAKNSSWVPCDSPECFQSPWKSSENICHKSYTKNHSAVASNGNGNGRVEHLGLRHLYWYKSANIANSVIDIKDNIQFRLRLPKSSWSEQVINQLFFKEGYFPVFSGRLLHSPGEAHKQGVRVWIWEPVVCKIPNNNTKWFKFFCIGGQQNHASAVAWALLTG